MSQQTQVDRVVPKFDAFVAAYPTPTACAAAPLGDLLTLWSGLGYPRRCRNLHEASKAIVERHDGVVPSTMDDLLALPGVHHHDYGKAPRAGRKLGHGTVVAPTARERDRRLARLARLVPR